MYNTKVSWIRTLQRRQMMTILQKLPAAGIVAITDAEWHYSQCEATLVADGKVDQTYVGLPVTLKKIR